MNNKPKYKSDRDYVPDPSVPRVKLNTLCTRCQKQIACEWPETTTWGGRSVTAAERMALSLRSESHGIYCDDCLEKMPDVKLEDLLVA